MNGRELDAYDVEWNYHRMLGMGDFTEDGPSARMYDIAQGIEIESVTATDKWTVAIKLTKPQLFVAQQLLNSNSHVYPREVAEKYGDFKDGGTWSAPGP